MAIHDVVLQNLIESDENNRGGTGTLAVWLDWACHEVEQRETTIALHDRRDGHVIALIVPAGKAER